VIDARPRVGGLRLPRARPADIDLHEVLDPPPQGAGLDHGLAGGKSVREIDGRVRRSDDGSFLPRRTNVGASSGSRTKERHHVVQTAKMRSSRPEGQDQHPEALIITFLPQNRGANAAIPLSDS